jgi:hypothetical protein
MSALPPKADIAQHGGHVCFVPKADIRLFNHLVRKCEKIGRNGEAERLGGFSDSA